MTVLTAAECLKIAERKMGEAVSDRRHGKELKATAQAWLLLADRIAQTEAKSVPIDQSSVAVRPTVATQK
jgi:hypothetical protein